MHDGVADQQAGDKRQQERERQRPAGGGISGRGVKDGRDHGRHRRRERFTVRHGEPAALQVLLLLTGPARAGTFLPLQHAPFH